MPIPLADLALVDIDDLTLWMKPQPVDGAQGAMMLQAALDAVTEAVYPRTTVPATARTVVLEAAKRALTPRVQQESLGSRSVSYFPPTDPRSGVFLTEDELTTLGVTDALGGVGVAWTSAPNGAGAWNRDLRSTGKWPWSPQDGSVPL